MGDPRQMRFELTTLWSDFCFDGRTDFRGAGAALKSSNGHPRDQLAAVPALSLVLACPA